MATIGGRNGIFSAQQNLSVAVSFQDLHSRDSKALVMLDFKDFCSVLVQYLSLSLCLVFLEKTSLAHACLESSQSLSNPLEPGGNPVRCLGFDGFKMSQVSQRSWHSTSDSSSTSFVVQLSQLEQLS